MSFWRRNREEAEGGAERARATLLRPLTQERIPSAEHKKAGREPSQLILDVLNQNIIGKSHSGLKCDAVFQCIRMRDGFQLILDVARRAPVLRLHGVHTWRGGAPIRAQPGASAWKSPCFGRLQKGIPFVLVHDFLQGPDYVVNKDYSLMRSIRIRREGTFSPQKLGSDNHGWTALSSCMTHIHELRG